MFIDHIFVSWVYTFKLLFWENKPKNALLMMDFFIIIIIIIIIIILNCYWLLSTSYKT